MKTSLLWVVDGEMEEEKKQPSTSHDKNCFSSMCRFMCDCNLILQLNKLLQKSHLLWDTSKFSSLVSCLWQFRSTSGPRSRLKNRELDQFLCSICDKYCWAENPCSANTHENFKSTFKIKFNNSPSWVFFVSRGCCRRLFWYSGALLSRRLLLSRLRNWTFGGHLAAIRPLLHQKLANNNNFRLRAAWAKVVVDVCTLEMKIMWWIILVFYL